VSEMREAQREIDEGRVGLNSATEELHRRVGLPPSLPSGQYLSRLAGEVFEVSSQRVGLRLDAASHDPSALACAAVLRAKGGVPLPQLARPVTLPRYVRYYVEPPHGRPVLSGRQMMQLRPVNLRRISDRSFKNPDDFVLKTGTTIFTCDGRAEEGLGEPAYVLPCWDGWMASEHVMRLVAEDGIGHGYLYICIASPWVQKQLKAFASGSVIDALEVEEVSKVVLPLLPETERKALDAEVVRCWNLISKGVTRTEEVVRHFEAMMGRKVAG
jgi:hypothetical protein